MSWEKIPRKHSYGEQYRLGKWIVGQWDLDSTRSHSEKARYAVECYLPGLRRLVGHRETVEEAKDLLEKAVVHWIKNAGF